MARIGADTETARMKQEPSLSTMLKALSLPKGKPGRCGDERMRMDEGMMRGV